MRTSPWLSCEDLDGIGEVKCEVEGVLAHRNATMQDGRKQPLLYAVKFKGKERQLVLNATNRKTLVALYGTDVKQWTGKTVTLFVQDGVRNPAGGKTKGIRIRNNQSTNQLKETPCPNMTTK